jgi:hypothetical protein
MLGPPLFAHVIPVTSPTVARCANLSRRSSRQPRVLLRPSSLSMPARSSSRTSPLWDGSMRHLESTPTNSSYPGPVPTTIPLGLWSVFGASETSTTKACLLVVCLPQCLQHHIFCVRRLLSLGAFDSLRTIAPSLTFFEWNSKRFTVIFIRRRETDNKQNKNPITKKRNQRNTNSQIRLSNHTAQNHSYHQPSHQKEQLYQLRLSLLQKVLLI